MNEESTNGKIDTIGNRLRRIRMARGLTTKEVAQAAGVAVSTYREWEYGRAIQGEPYVALSRVLGVSLLELLTGAAPAAQDGWMKNLQALKDQVQVLERQLLNQ